MDNIEETRAERLRKDILEAIARAKKDDAEFMKKAEKQEAEGDLTSAYLTYLEIESVGFADALVGAESQLTDMAFERRVKLGMRIREKALAEIDSNPIGELTCGSGFVRSVCCSKLRDAIESEGVSLFSEGDDSAIEVSNYFQYYDEIDENVDMRSYPEGTFLTDSCPFCGKKIVRKE